MSNYQVKGVEALTAAEIAIILQHWEVAAWQHLTPQDFRRQFARSEFHLLTDERSTILSLARINFDFTLRIGNQQYEFAEFVGFVSVQKGRGYGRQLLRHLKGNLQKRGLESIGFCEKDLRPFYQQCQVEILYDKAKAMREYEAGQWLRPSDDDILNIHLPDEKRELLHRLHDGNPAYLISEAGDRTTAGLSYL